MSLELPDRIDPFLDISFQVKKRSNEKSEAPTGELRFFLFEFDAISNSEINVI